MRQLIAIFFLATVFPFSGCWCATSAPLDEFKLGAHTIQVSLQVDPPRLGSNTLFIKIRGYENSADAKDQISATLTMPAMAAMPGMAAMPAMNVESTISDLGSGQYKADFDLPMEGSWTLDIKITTAQGTIQKKYSLVVGRKGLL